MDEEDPNGFIALRRKALATQKELQSLAKVFHIAVQGLKEPEMVSDEDVRLICEAVLRYLKPTISAGRAQP